MAAGMSLGPIAINATAPIKAISDQAKSNMGARCVSGGRSHRPSEKGDPSHYA
jgi:hypothetical protein